MISELIYTSARCGIRPGSSGYCTVAQSQKITPALAGTLEGLSVYHHRHVNREPSRVQNPVIASHFLVSVGYQPISVVSRIVDAGLDHSERGNYLAHHLALELSDRPEAGPTVPFTSTGIFLDRWDRDPLLLPPRPSLPHGSLPAARCALWEKTTGDAGWGGVLASSIDGTSPILIVTTPHQPTLDFFVEALSLLRPEDRWKVSFSTYFLGIPAGVRCQWRCVPTDHPKFEELIATASGPVLRLDRPMTGQPSGLFVKAARTGSAPSLQQNTPAPKRTVATSPPRVEITPDPIIQEKAKCAVEPELADISVTPRMAPNKMVPNKKALSLVSRGLVIGMLFGAILISASEAATGRSLLRWAGRLGTDEKKSQRDNMDLGAELVTSRNEMNRERELKEKSDIAKVKLASDYQAAIIVHESWKGDHSTSNREVNILNAQLTAETRKAASEKEGKESAERKLQAKLKENPLPSRVITRVIGAGISAESVIAILPINEKWSLRYFACSDKIKEIPLPEEKEGPQRNGIRLSWDRHNMEFWIVNSEVHMKGDMKELAKQGGGLLELSCIDRPALLLQPSEPLKGEVKPSTEVIADPVSNVWVYTISTMAFPDLPEDRFYLGSSAKIKIGTKVYTLTSAKPEEGKIKELRDGSEPDSGVKLELLETKTKRGLRITVPKKVNESAARPLVVQLDFTCQVLLKDETKVSVVVCQVGP